jgi:hypothetical protein
LTPYPDYIELLIHGILNPLPMVFWPLYIWYIGPSTNGILTPLHMVFYPLPMVYQTLYPWYFDSLTMVHCVYWTPYS